LPKSFLSALPLARLSSYSVINSCYMDAVEVLLVLSQFHGRPPKGILHIQRRVEVEQQFQNGSTPPLASPVERREANCVSLQQAFLSFLEDAQEHL
jgi:hypothetical protein